jgi:Lon-like protease
VFAPPRPTPVPSGLVIVCALAIIIVAVFNFHISSYFAIRPGPAPDVTRLIEITGAPTKPVSGRLLLTTVSLQEIIVAEAVRGWFDPNYEILPRSAVIAPGQTEEDAQRQTSQQMDESHQHAAAAALAFLGYDVRITPIGARVVELIPGTPASKVLRRDDVIVGADESPVRRDVELRNVIQRHKVGDAIALKVRRGKTTVTVRTKTVGDPEDPTRPIIGVAFLENVPDVKLPLAVNIESLGIGGPSAGLMFALGIVELLDSTDMTKNRTIAGTGAISLGGAVQPVGGVRQKVVAARQAGAVMFLAPLIELSEACAAAGKLTVIGVQNLRDAVSALRGAKVPDGRTCA